MLFINSDKKSEAQWVGIAGGGLSFLYWLFFYALFPVKKECNTNNAGSTEAAAPKASFNAVIANRWSDWVSNWSYSGTVALLFVTVIAFLGGFILGNING